MRFYTYITSGTYDDQMAILPAIDVTTYPMNTLQLTLDVRANSTSYPFVLIVGVLTNPSDATTFVPVDTITTQVTTYANYEIPFANYTGTGSFIGIVAKQPTSGYNYGYVDNIMVDVAPNCSKPAQVSIGGVTASQVTVDWTATGQESVWEVAVVPQGQDLATTTPEQVYAHPHTINNLTDDTHYEVYVRAVCPTSGFSSWTPAVSFRTDPLCTPPTSVMVSQVRGTSALVSWNSALVGADSYTVEYTEQNLNNWVPATVSATQYMLSGLTPQTTYEVRVFSNCLLGDADTVTKTFVTGCLAGGDIEIGNGTTTNAYLPSYSTYEDSYTQQIFTAAELGGATTFNSISFQVAAWGQNR
jgi:hypothetical protein